MSDLPSNSRFRLLSEQAVNVLELALPIGLDEVEFDQLLDSLQQAIAAQSTRKWVVDLRQTEYLGSAMLGLLVNLRQSIRQGDGHLALCGLSPRLHTVFRACSLERLFVIARTRPEAIAALSYR